MNDKDKWIGGTSTKDAADPDWDKKLITELATASLKEQSRSRRWGIFFKFLGFAYLTILLLTAFRNQLFDAGGTDGTHTAVVDVVGVIAADQPANANDIVSSLEAAFEDSNTAAVLLRINSPGGSPVQSGYIYDEIMRLRNKYKETPLYAVIEDTCASGGYYIASAAEKIYADKASVVGSIGVRMDGFGFVGTMDKLGIERRLLTSGENKALLDPFTPLKETQLTHIKQLLNNIHQQFISAVKTGRGDRLSNDPDLFTGLIWSGEQALELGLVDKLASERTIARDIIGSEKIVNFSAQEDLLSRFADRVGVSISRSSGFSLEQLLQLR